MGFRPRARFARVELRYYLQTVSSFLYFNLFFPSHLTLAEKPTIRYPIDPRVSYNEGSSVVLQCTATGVPDPDVRWIRDGYVRTSGTNTTYFTFSSIKKTDAGYYTCRGNNSAGSVIKQVYVTVNCKYLKDAVESSCGCDCQFSHTPSTRGLSALFSLIIQQKRKLF